MNDRLVGIISSDAQLIGEVSTNSQINVTVDSIGSSTKSYTHPDTHPASMIVEDESKMFMTITDKADIEGLKNRESFVHDQIISSNEWTVNHGLDKYPSITVVDSSGSVVIGEIIYTSLNEVTITFMSEFSGKAYFN